MTRLRGVLLLCALALVRARWVLVFWPNFDVSMPSCKVDGVSGLELSYDELSCGDELSASCYPSTCTDVCKDDPDCEFVVAKTNALTGGGVQGKYWELALELLEDCKTWATPNTIS